MRAFLALTLPKKERTRINRSARPLREREVPVRWTDLENYHVTLKFLGDIRGTRVETVKQVMREVAESTAPFHARIGAFGAFPTIRRPEVLWVGIEASPELRCLKQDLEWGLAGHDFPRETRAFHPHITLGRASSDSGAGAFRGLDDLVADLEHDGEFVVRSVDLLQTHRTEDGVRYSSVESVRLRGD
jgi:2'-5' RNA ligase